MSVNLCVIPRDNTSEKLAETNIENALERSVNVLNSDTMRDQIMKASGSSRVKGNLSASVVADTNIIRMSASGTNAVSYTHLRAHETDSYLVCRLLLEKKK